MTPKPIWAFPIAVDRPLRQAGLARRRVGSRSRFKTRKKEASMVAEGAPNLPIHPRPSADPLNHLNGLLSADVRQLGNAVLVVYVAGELDMLTGPPLQDHLDELLAT